MIIKVCGLKDENQILQLDQLESIHWLGSIFYKNSKRYVEACSLKVDKSKKVGVFVNERISEIRNTAENNKLGILQLHGSETAEFCRELKRDYTIIKAFGIDELFDFELLSKYEKEVDYFLFDTKTPEHGGSGKLFNWRLLEKYKLNVPFLLSGGLNSNSIQEITEVKHPFFVGIDLNSGFENKPGDKNIEKIKKFMIELMDSIEINNRNNGEN